jgi:Aspartyl protease
MIHFVKQFVIAACILVVNLSAASDKPFQIERLNFPNAEIITENTIRVPFQIIDHLIVIKAKADGKEGNFIIDTGSETLVLNEVHFKNYNKRHYRTTSGVNGIIDKAYLKKLDNFFLERFSIDNISADIIDLSHIEKSKKTAIFGIIGYSVLKEYEIFIDFYLKQITLSKTDEQGNRIDKDLLLEKITDSIAFKQKKHTIIVEAFIADEKLNFGLDSGAEINHLSTAVSKKVLKNFKVSKRITMLGAGKESKEVLAGKLYQVKLTNTLYCGVMRTVLTHLNGMNEAYGTTLDGILGYEFLATRRMMINYKKKKLYFVNYPYLKN